jgi:hypothetical protein
MSYLTLTMSQIPVGSIVEIALANGKKEITSCIGMVPLTDEMLQAGLKLMGSGNPETFYCQIEVDGDDSCIFAVYLQGLDADCRVFDFQIPDESLDLFIEALDTCRRMRVARDSLLEE